MTMDRSRMLHVIMMVKKKKDYSCITDEQMQRHHCSTHTLQPNVSGQELCLFILKDKPVYAKGLKNIGVAMERESFEQCGCGLSISLSILPLLKEFQSAVCIHTRYILCGVYVLTGEHTTPRIPYRVKKVVTSVHVDMFLTGRMSFKLKTGDRASSRAGWVD